MKIKSGGGINSNKTVQSQSAWKVEPKPRAVSVPAVAQLGRSEQFKKPNLEMGPGYSTKPMGSTGIAGARKGHEGAGPGGGGRTIYAKGSQSPTPAPREIPKGHDILNDYGRDVPGRK